MSISNAFKFYKNDNKSEHKIFLSSFEVNQLFSKPQLFQMYFNLLWQLFCLDVQNFDPNLQF